VIRMGIDLVDIDVIARSVELAGDDFLNLAWTLGEQDYCRRRPDRLASQWAAKEATMKVLGVGLGDIDLLDIEVATVDGCAPRIVLHGSARDRAKALGVGQLSASISHDRRVAIAFVVGLDASDG
jgi:holo-[acyl-carrier protein] synthase